MILETRQETIIASDRLQVKVARPGTAYTGSRFDWTGFITQVELDGRHHFCAFESLAPGYGTGGIGLCSAFRQMPETDAAIGAQFAKPGIGLLTRFDDAPYTAFKAYEVEPFAFQEQAGPDLLVQVAEPRRCNGYAFRSERILTVADNRLEIRTTFHNCGDKSLETEEFNHNFVCIDGHSVGPDYRLRMPYEPVPEIARGGPLFDGCSLQWDRVPEEWFMLTLHGGETLPTHWWELVHEPTGVGMRESGDFTISRFDLWGRSYVVSPEVFVRIRLEPGQARTWTRTFEFFD